MKAASNNKIGERWKRGIGTGNFTHRNDIMKREQRGERSNRKRGSMGVTMAIGLVLALFMGAMAVDVGYMMMAKTQMQAVADSAALAAGTELMPGLGQMAYRTPSEVAAAGREAAVAFARENRAGDVRAAFVDPERDVFFGRAIFDSTSGSWQRTWGAAPFNMASVVVHRNQEGSANGDHPLPLFFARVMRRPTQNLRTFATAVLLPVRGFRVIEADQVSNIMPFAYREDAWRKLEEAQQWYYNPYDNPNSTPREIPPDYTPGDEHTRDYPMTEDGRPMFHSPILDNNGNPVIDPNTGEIMYEQDTFDNFSWHESTESVAGSTNFPQRDGWLEVNIYPQHSVFLSAGNSGTIDLGETNNSTNDLKRQIEEGLNWDDYQAMDEQGLLNGNGEFVLGSESEETYVSVDSGISASIKNALEGIIGQPKVITLFDRVEGGGGETATLRLVRFVGIRVMEVNLTGNPKTIYVQMAPVIDGTGLPDLENEIGADTTVFSPLILID